MTTLRVTPSAGLRGEIAVPGDKSISHRAVILGAIAEGETRVENMLRAEDTLSTIRCLQQMGVRIEDSGSGPVVVHGVGLRGLRAPAGPLDVGNSGTSLRLLLGLLAGQDFAATLTGDASLRTRPHAQVVAPLRMMGASIECQGERCLAPVTVRGGQLRGIEYTLPVASAQFKSAVLLAGLYAEGETTVIEPSPCRDHTERMLRYFGARLGQEGPRITIGGGQKLTGSPVVVTSDISSAAFFLVAASIVPGSRVRIPGVGVNPTRDGALEVLERMGACITRSAERNVAGEPVADLEVESASLVGTEIGGDLIPRLIDELPVLAVAAAVATGETVIRDAAQLRVKESDRIVAIADGLTRMGAEVEERPDGLRIAGSARLRGAVCDAPGDHRMAMAFAVAGLVATGETVITGAESIGTSFPEFPGRMQGIGAVMRESTS
jgi:3-phosphoshikimate 1-carboxyvinyltransferase